MAKERSILKPQRSGISIANARRLIDQNLTGARSPEVRELVHIIYRGSSDKAHKHASSKNIPHDLAKEAMRDAVGILVEHERYVDAGVASNNLGLSDDAIKQFKNRAIKAFNRELGKGNVVGAAQIFRGFHLDKIDLNGKQRRIVKAVSKLIAEGKCNDAYDVAAMTKMSPEEIQFSALAGIAKLLKNNGNAREVTYAASAVELFSLKGETVKLLKPLALEKIGSLFEIGWVQHAVSCGKTFLLTDNELRDLGLSKALKLLENGEPIMAEKIVAEVGIDAREAEFRPLVVKNMTKLAEDMSSHAITKMAETFGINEDARADAICMGVEALVAKGNIENAKSLVNSGHIQSIYRPFILSGMEKLADEGKREKLLEVVEVFDIKEEELLEVLMKVEQRA